MRRLLIVDDDDAIRLSLVAAFKNIFEIKDASGGREAIAILGDWIPDVILLDQRMLDMDGLETLDHIKDIDPDIPVVMITAYGTVAEAVKAMQHGALDYIQKPYDIERVRLVVNRAASIGAMKRELSELKGEINVLGMVGASDAMKQVFNTIQEFAPTDLNILITGPTGVGKEMAAKAIHFKSTRRQGPFIAINLAAIPENLMESELFGYEKGAFTGAATSKAGKVELADSGTLFLDEIGDMDRVLQAKLLRFLETRTVERLGSISYRQVDVRLVSATNRDLVNEVDTGAFREDLFYRLNTVCINIPPLRERLEDIPLLTNHFISRYNRRFNKDIQGVSQEVMDLFLSLPWRGNVRELMHTIEFAVARCKTSTITRQDLPEHVSIVDTSPATNSSGLVEAVENLEKQMIQSALMSTGNNRTRAASILGISLRTLQYKLKKYNMG
ncbi:MAG TPA: sigma-54-dependent Fis family transcriptional regulator [Deltaproteobacteria bacterium]|nr:sigma-54-dependent Fis family transcriptional regulator [Deltaproteobacteria bacterium]